MEDIFIGRLMSSNVITVESDTLVEDAAETLLDKEIGSLVVVDDDNHVAGILTGTDFVRIVSENTPKDKSTVAEHMTEQVVTVTAQDSIREAADKLLTHNIDHLPVVDSKEGVIGMLSTTDIAAYISGVEEPSPEWTEA